jgi:hypothetical protein
VRSSATRHHWPCRCIVRAKLARSTHRLSCVEPTCGSGRTFDEISRSIGAEPDVRSYEAVLAACLNASNAAGGLAFMSEMKGVPHIRPDDSLYSVMVALLGQAVAQAARPDMAERAAALENLLLVRRALFSLAPLSRAAVDVTSPPARNTHCALGGALR